MFTRQVLDVLRPVNRKVSYQGKTKIKILSHWVFLGHISLVLIEKFENCVDKSCGSGVGIVEAGFNLEPHPAPLAHLFSE